MKVNNVGTTTVELNSSLGETIDFESTESITILSGEIGEGFLLFDPIGTLGVVMGYKGEDEFKVKTFALSIDLEAILNSSY